jgi:hypothetical protein
MSGPWPTDEYQEPPDDAFPAPEPPVAVPAAVIASTLQTLNLLDDFFRRHASTATRTELRAFAALQGWDPVQGAEILIEGLGLDALRLHWARDATRPDPSTDTDQPPPPTNLSAEAAA